VSCCADGCCTKAAFALDWFAPSVDTIGASLPAAVVAIDPQPGTPMPMPRMMAAPMAMAAPAPEMASEAGVETVRVGVQGEALARPRP